MSRKFIVIYDREWEAEVDTLEQAREIILDAEHNFLQNKAKHPKYFGEDEEYPFDMWDIHEVIIPGDDVKRFVKNST